MEERGSPCARCGGGPIRDGHMEGSGAPVLFRLDPGKSGAAGVRCRVCLACGHLDPYVDADKLKGSAGL